MDGTRNIGGAVGDGEGKSAKEIECIVADAGARSQGAMAGSSIAAGVGVPAVIGIPYVGWLAAGWVALLGGRVGSNIGSTVGSVFNDC
jgi:tripartite-type tricarboxylate transporter receptor subunit TctC